MRSGALTTNATAAARHKGVKVHVQPISGLCGNGGELLQGKCSTPMHNGVTARIQSSCGVLADASKCRRTPPPPCPEYTVLPTLHPKPRPPTLEYNNNSPHWPPVSTSRPPQARKQPHHHASPHLPQKLASAEGHTGAKCADRHASAGPLKLSGWLCVGERL